MPLGDLHYEKAGTVYGGAKMYSSISRLSTSKPGSAKTPYIPGSGVGAKGFATRRHLVRQATTCHPKVTCNAAINNLDPYQFFMVRYHGV